jgi:hypothetical protein
MIPQCLQYLFSVVFKMNDHAIPGLTAWGYAKQQFSITEIMVRNVQKNPNDCRSINDKRNLPHVAAMVVMMRCSLIRRHGAAAGIQ